MYCLGDGLVVAAKRLASCARGILTEDVYGYHDGCFQAREGGGLFHKVYNLLKSKMMRLVKCLGLPLVVSIFPCSCEAGSMFHKTLVSCIVSMIRLTNYCRDLL